MMKYFKPELWEKINSENKNEREQAEIEWEKHDKEYWESFQKTKENLPQEFLGIYQKNHCFHDCLVSGFKVIKRPEDDGGAVSIELKISNESHQWLIQYGNVTRLKFDFIAENEPSFFAGVEENSWDEWGYDEFSLINQDAICHQILFSSGRTITIHFTTIGVKDMALVEVEESQLAN